MNIKETVLFIKEKIEEKKGEDVIILDIGKKTSIADYMLIASVSNERLLGAVAEYIDDELAELGIHHKNIEGKKESGWILIDYNDIIVNLLTGDMRDKYSIEKIWVDCDRLM